MTDWRAGNGVPAVRSVRSRMCILMACADMREADQVGRVLAELNTGCLVTYRRASDMIHAAPSGTVALVILATDDSTAALAEMLRWLRRRWPRCSITVVGDQGAGEYELAARAGAALYLTRPVAPKDWTAILSHVLAVRTQRPSREEAS